MDCVVCSERDIGDNHHCLIENRIEGGRKGWEDREPTYPSFAQRLAAGFYLLECGEDRHDG